MSAAKKSKQFDKKHIVDVRKPGTAMPSPTSRPVIVGNRPLLKDPMVVDKTGETEEKNDKSPKLSAADKPKLQPLEPTLSEEPSDEMTTQPDGPRLAAADTPVTDSLAQSTAVKAEMEEALSQPEKPESDTQQDADTPSVSSVDTQALDNPESAAKQAETEAIAKTKHDAAVQELADSKQYALPIHTVEQRNSRRVVIIGIVLSAVLLLVWLNVALDAGIIKLGGLQPLTDFFPN